MKKLIVMNLIGAAAGGFGTYFLLDYFQVDLSLNTLFWLCVYFWFGHYLSVFFHELGHLAGGAARGMTFYSILVGPVLITKERSKTRVKWEKHGLSIGGRAAMYPDLTERKASIEKQLYWHILGGPLASLITGAAALIVSLVLHEVWLFVFAVISLLAGVTNLLITEAKDAIPDGAALKNLRNPLTKEVFIAAYLIAGNVREDWSELPADIAERARKAITGFPENMMSLSIASALSQYDMSRGAPGEAVKLLRIFVMRTPDKKKRSIFWEQTYANYLLACYMAGETGVELSAIADNVQKRDPLAYEKAQFAAAALTGDHLKAEAALKKAIACSSSMYALYGDGEMERKLLKRADCVRKSVTA
ncbi:hypothetical protein CEF21_05895 [Bacillus sp. FJAT-42376]|uniref:site-2 protease family protein n=1 Tax=Bacillus sp. FJAT-42376 TaxID=2014076 RepID=UPI000F4EB192|nr:site-2 protease family protein [Bacillus sp. FJAT-42376]AZB41872.1 hypothetical protein CEF21_05895 [Bacillus sp. FJAT-42376]